MRSHALTLAITVLSLGPATLRAQAPVTHRFVPTQFYTTYSFAHPPALRIKPGDRVITKTIDAAGTDWEGKAVSPGGNPQTGPFYIEGAEPGDAIVVTFDRIETNRATGYSGSLLAPYTVDPAALSSRVDREPKRMIWNIDKAKGIVWIESRCRSSRCSGVSAWRRRARRPSRQSRPAPSAGTWTTPGSAPAPNSCCP
jgi:hypothetical protein